MGNNRRGKGKYPKEQRRSGKSPEIWDPLILVLSSQPTEGVVQEMLDRLGVRGTRRRSIPDTRIPLADVPPSDVPPSDVPPSDVPPSDVPPSDVPPSDVPPSDVPPTPVPMEEVGGGTHKNRADWFRHRFAYPVREARVPSNRQPLTVKPASEWRFIGPTNFSGRITSLVCDPDDSRTIYAGSAGGGVWRSGDAGKKWEPLWDDRTKTAAAPGFTVLSVGALAITKKKALYAGTGEANLSSDNYPGNGAVYRLLGDKWTSLDSTTIPSRIGAIAIDPFDLENDQIRIGGVRHSDEYPCGMFVFDAEKKEWARDPLLDDKIMSKRRVPAGAQTAFGVTTPDVNRLVSGVNYFCHSIVFHPKDKKVIFAAIDARGSQSGIWRYRSGEWNRLEVGLPPGDEFARTSLAITGPDLDGPAVIYALAADRAGGVLGVFRSDDNGDTWDEIGNGKFRYETQMSYNNCIAVHPGDPDFAIWGGIDLHRTKDGGNTWQKVTRSELSARRKGDPRYVHQDHHALLIVPHPREKKDDTVYKGKVIGVRGELTVSLKGGILIYDGNDGGVSVSEDGGDTWHDRSNTLGTTMFYDVDVAQADTKGHIVAGGTQDNGTLMTHRARPVSGKVKPSDGEFSRKLGGDGGWVVFDPKDATHFYASSERMYIYRRRVGARLRQVTPAGLTAYERAGIWMAFIDMDLEDPRTVFTASDRIWRTLNDGKSWRASRSLDGSPVSAIEVTTRNRRRIYAGTENGGFFRSLDGGDTWSQNMAGAVLPGRIVTRIEAHPDNEDIVFVTVGSVGTIGVSAPEPYSGPRVTSDKVTRFSHVFQSRDGGETWEDADPKGTLPDVPHLALAFETHKPHRLFVAGDVWIYMLDETGQWITYTDNLPSVTVTDLVYHRATRTLTAATYGRGLWSRHVKEAPKA